MPALLAQTGSNPFDNLFDTVVSLFSIGDALARPAELVDALQNLMVVWAVVFVVVGVLCMLNGYRFYRVATIALALFMGLFAGYALGKLIQAPPYIIAGCCGLLLAVVALPLMQYAIALFGGLVGAFLGANLWSGAADALNVAAGWNIPDNAFWVGALIGLLICGMLSFILFKLSIVMFTSVSGSTLAVMGVIALLLSFEPWRAGVAESLTASRAIIPLLVFVPAFIGLVLQEYWGAGAKGEPKKS